MGTIYLVRHGQTVHNRERILQGPRLDGPLSELGLRQAQSLAGALADVGLAAVYSSPLRRARQTAEAVVHGHRANRTERRVRKTGGDDANARGGATDAHLALPTLPHAQASV